jgi:hypothetical protein
VDGTDLLEVRSTGGQTVAPPSVWRDKEPPHTTEPVVRNSFTEPAEIDFAALLAAARSVAAAAILARHWPAKGSRHDPRLALSGALARVGRTEDRITGFVRAATVAAGNQDVRDAEAVGGSTLVR